MNIYLTERELAHVLAALRILQAYLGGGPRRLSLLDVARVMTDDGRHQPLTAHAVGELCERINIRWEEA